MLPADTASDFISSFDARQQKTTLNYIHGISEDFNHNFLVYTYNIKIMFDLVLVLLAYYFFLPH